MRAHSVVAQRLRVRYWGRRKAMKRAKYPTRTIYLAGQQQREMAERILASAPLDSERPLEFILREKVKTRKPDQNSLMWSGPLADIASQAYVNKRTYSAEIWHEFFKAEYLPEEADERYTKPDYRKWDTDPSGNRVLVGSTTQLTIAGFAIYLEKLMAYGAQLGVMYSASPREYAV